MTPAELREWSELLTRQPLIGVILAWAVLELRRFIKAMQAHDDREEVLLAEILDVLRDLPRAAHGGYHAP
jgi:hypothetical protein